MFSFLNCAIDDTGDIKKFWKDIANIETEG